MKLITETDFYRRDELIITKLEELESFHAIKTILVPLFVESWNKNIKFDSFGTQPISVEDVLKKLKKVYREPEEIRYSYDVSLDEMNRELYFYSEKHLRDEDQKTERPAIRVWYYDAYAGGFRFHYLEDIYYQKINELREEVSRPDMSISKIEEHEALNCIKRKVVEKMVNLFNYYADQKDFPYQFPQHSISPTQVIRKHITNRDITSRLRKTFHEKKGESKKSQYSDYIEYTSTVYGINLVFFIKKHAELVEDGCRDVLLVGLMQPYLDDEVIAYSFSDLNEGVADKEKYAEYQKQQAILGHIDKFEEQRSLDFLRKVVVPKLVQHYNYRTNDKPSIFNSFKPLKPVNVADVNRNLKKSRHLMFGEKGNPRGFFSDYIEYTSKVGDNLFSFYIDKMYDQTHGVPPNKRRIVLGCGFDDPFVLQKWSYQVGERYL